MPSLHPDFIKNMAGLLGDALDAFIAALEDDYAAALRVNPLRRASAEAAREFIAGAVPWAKHGYYIRENTRPGAGLAHFAGAFYIQEASAMLPAAILDAQPGEKVLDLCAAPGGKSSQIAAALMGEGLLISNEPDTKRAKMLAGNLERLGVKNAVVVNEYPPKLTDKWPGFFDAILVDAPCSGEGMFRREPDSRDEWQSASPEGCARRQAGILDCAAEMLRPGGRMVYSTCTYNREENEDTVAAFLERHPEFTAANFRAEGIGDSDGGMMKIYPHRVKGDGQFAALLIKAADAPVRALSPAPQKALSAFMSQFGSIQLPDGKPVIWGENLALMPAGAPPLEGIKVVSPGLMLAKIIGKRLEPEHQLAMCCEDAAGVELNDEQALAFVRGEAVDCDGKGWLVARWRGMPLGWGKASGGALKNHVPKGIRRNIQG